MGVNSYYVQKLLHCFSIKISHIPLGVGQFQKLEEIAGSVCLSWDKQCGLTGESLFHPPQPLLICLSVSAE